MQQLTFKSLVILISPIIIMVPATLFLFTWLLVKMDNTPIEPQNPYQILSSYQSDILDQENDDLLIHIHNQENSLIALHNSGLKIR